MYLDVILTQGAYRVLDALEKFLKSIRSPKMPGNP